MWYSSGETVGQTAVVAFRQQFAPTASVKQIQQLRSLLEDVGYADFRSARGPLGLTQRQGLGKFTGLEAEALIDQLELDAEGAAAPVVATADPDDANPRPLLHTSTDELVAELRLRGWKPSEW